MCDIIYGMVAVNHTCHRLFTLLCLYYAHDVGGDLDQDLESQGIGVGEDF